MTEWNLILIFNHFNELLVCAIFFNIVAILTFMATFDIYFFPQTENYKVLK